MANLGWLVNDGSFAVRPVRHADHQWECMDFDSESGHRCAHCGAKYPRDNHEPVEHAENCPHEIASAK